MAAGGHIEKSTGHIFTSETRYPIHFMYVHRPYYALGLMTVDAYDSRRLDSYFTRRAGG